MKRERRPAPTDRQPGSWASEPQWHEGGGPVAGGTLDGAADRFANPYPPKVGHIADYQMPGRLQWPLVNDHEAANAAASVIHVRPYGASTVTVVNPLEPDPDGYRVPPGVDHPALRPIRGGRI